MTETVDVGEEALDFLPYKEVARRLRVSVSTVRRLADDGDIRRVHIGRAARITPESVAAYKVRLCADAEAARTAAA